MSTTSNINIKRVLIGGFAASVLIFMIMGAINGMVLNESFENWRRTMGALTMPPAQSTSMILWSLMSVIFGFGGVWLYAAIRPRFGAGPKTALIAALAIIIIGKVTAAMDVIALGIFPNAFVIGQFICGFIAILVAVFVGAWLYKEE